MKIAIVESVLLMALGLTRGATSEVLIGTDSDLLPIIDSEWSPNVDSELIPIVDSELLPVVDSELLPVASCENFSCTRSFDACVETSGGPVCVLKRAVCEEGFCSKGVCVNDRRLGPRCVPTCAGELNLECLDGYQCPVDIETGSLSACEIDSRKDVSCKTIKCAGGFVCEEKGKRPMCVPAPPPPPITCANVRCGFGLTCVDTKEGPKCLCGGTTECPLATECVNGGCFPVSPPTCASTLCLEGYLCIDEIFGSQCVLACEDSSECGEFEDCVEGACGTQLASCAATSCSQNTACVEGYFGAQCIPICGTILGLACPASKDTDYVCIDDPRDGCDPRTGGADCSGLCQPFPSFPNDPAPTPAPITCKSYQCEFGLTCVDTDEGPQCLCGGTTECPLDEECVDDACVPTPPPPPITCANVRCGFGLACVDTDEGPQCLCGGTTECPLATECVNGACFPVSPPTCASTLCEEGYLCIDEIFGSQCVLACEESSECGQFEDCVEGACGPKLASCAATSCFQNTACIEGYFGAQCIPICGTIQGLDCPKSMGMDYVCIDDPRDDCDPRTGGADCSGLCQPFP